MPFLLVRLAHTFALAFPKTACMLAGGLLLGRMPKIPPIQKHSQLTLLCTHGGLETCPGSLQTSSIVSFLSCNSVPPFCLLTFVTWRRRRRRWRWLEERRHLGPDIACVYFYLCETFFPSWPWAGGRKEGRAGPFGFGRRLQADFMPLPCLAPAPHMGGRLHAHAWEEEELCKPCLLLLYLLTEASLCTHTGRKVLLPSLSIYGSGGSHPSSIMHHSIKPLFPLCALHLASDRKLHPKVWLATMKRREELFSLIFSSL